MPGGIAPVAKRKPLARQAKSADAAAHSKSEGIYPLDLHWRILLVLTMTTVFKPVSFLSLP